MTSSTTTTEISTQVRNALARMPYSGAIAMQPASVTTNDDLVRWLNQLADTLQRTSANHEDTARELRELQRQRAAVRAFLGTDAL